MGLDYDSFVIEELKRVYGSNLNTFLESLKTPNSRLYVRVNTIKTTPEDLVRKLEYFKTDEDLQEALYVEVKGPYKIDIHDTLVVVDKRTAESAMLGAYVYKPGIKRIIGDKKKKEVTVIAEDGTPVAEGILKDDKVIVTRSVYHTPPLAETKEFYEGLFYIQEKPSMYVARLVDPRPNERIIDMNCAPGGKLTHLYQLEPRAKIIGFDRTESKINKVKVLLDRLGIKGVEVIKGDSRYLYEDFGIKDVDKVLIDPPCSALGIRPKIFDKKSKEDLLRLSAYQRQFINSAYKVLKKGGVVIYSTCTVTSIENEEVINDPRFEVEEIIRFHTFIHDTPGYFIAKLRKK